MTEPLLLRRLRLIGAKGDSAFEFRKRVTIITGPVASGKTSLLEMIKHSFGAEAVITKTVRRNVKAVEATVKVGADRLTLTRPIGPGRDTVEVVFLDSGERQLLPVKGEESTLTISSFLMERLRVPQLRFPASRVEPDEELTTVTFNDVYGLMYLDQEQIDGSIGYDGPRNRKWRQTFEVIYGLADAQIATLRRDLGAANADYSRVATYLREVERFLEAVGYNARTGSEARRERISRKLDQLDRRLAQLRGTARAAEQDPGRAGTMTAAESALDAMRREMLGRLAERDALKRVEAQLRGDIEQVRRAVSATQLIRELEFDVCPRCAQSLKEPADTSSCRLCHQPEPAAQSNLGAEIELRRLERQLVETRALLEETERASQEAEQSIDVRQAVVERLRREWDADSRAALAPFIEEISRLSEQRGALERSLAETEEAGRLAGELAAAQTELGRLRGEQQRLNAAIAAGEGMLDQGRASLQALSEAYAQLITDIDMPWAETAHIHPKQYVPIIDGEPIRALSSGGLKTMANFAFYLAQLQITLRGYPTFLPPFMVIDSPRKNFGSNEEDAESMRRFYRALYALLAQRTGREFQVIVADNDSPSDERNRFQMLELDRENPLVNIKLLSDGVDPEN